MNFFRYRSVMRSGSTTFHDTSDTRRVLIKVTKSARTNEKCYAVVKLFGLSCCFSDLILLKMYFKIDIEIFFVIISMQRIASFHWMRSITCLADIRVYLRVKSFIVAIDNWLLIIGSLTSLS